MNEISKRTFVDTKTGANVTLNLLSRNWHKDGWWMEHWVTEDAVDENNIFKQVDPLDTDAVYSIKPNNKARTFFRFSRLDKSGVDHHIDLMYPPNP